MQAVFIEGEGAEVVVARGIELAGGEGGAGRKDPGELSADELAGRGGFRLVADRDFLAGGEQLVDVVVEGVGGKAGHGVVLPLRQGEAEQAGGDHGIVEK